MQPKLLLLLLLLPGKFLPAQSSDPWIRFEDKEKGLFGYKDLKNRVRLPARFNSFTKADTFHHIMTVWETGDNKSSFYYLLKDGRKVGRDSVWHDDYIPDCEQEGKIRFRDNKKGKVGFFGKDGSVVIPALYDEADPFYNGMSLVLRNAQKVYYDSDIHREHPYWKGGEWLLINEKNEVLVEGMSPEYRLLDPYSVRIDDASVDTGVYRTFRGVNGRLYAFALYEKEFTHWFHNRFLPALREDQVAPFLLEAITYMSKQNQNLKQVSKKEFLSMFYSPLKERLLKATPQKLKIFNEKLNENRCSGPSCRVFYTSCGEHFGQRYPLFSVVTTYEQGDGRIGYKDAAFFIRTDKEYRLLSFYLDGWSE